MALRTEYRSRLLPRSVFSQLAMCLSNHLGEIQDRIHVKGNAPLSQFAASDYLSSPSCLLHLKSPTIFLSPAVDVWVTRF